MKSNIPEYVVRMCGDMIKVTKDDLADEKKVEEVKQELMKQAMHVVKAIVEENIKFYQGEADGDPVLAWVLPCAVKNAYCTIENVPGADDENS